MSYKAEIYIGSNVPSSSQPGTRGEMLGVIVVHSPDDRLFYLTTFGKGKYHTAESFRNHAWGRVLSNEDDRRHFKIPDELFEILSSQSPEDRSETIQRLLIPKKPVEVTTDPLSGAHGSLLI